MTTLPLPPQAAASWSVLGDEEAAAERRRSEAQKAALAAWREGGGEEQVRAGSARTWLAFRLGFGRVVVSELEVPNL